MIAFGECVHAACLDVDSLKIDASFFRALYEYGVSVGAPVGLRSAGRFRGGLISTDATTDIEVVSGGKVFRLRTRLDTGYEEVGLTVRALNDTVSGVDLADKREPPAIRAERQRTNSAIDAGDFLDFASARVHNVNIAVRRSIIRLFHSIGHEVKLRAIARPGNILFVEFARGDLPRLLGSGQDIGDTYNPNVIGPVRFGVAFCVFAVLGANNDANIAFGRFVFFLVEVFGEGGGGKGYGFAVWRPDERAPSLRHFG